MNPVEIGKSDIERWSAEAAGLAKETVRRRNALLVQRAKLEIKATAARLRSDPVTAATRALGTRRADRSSSGKGPDNEYTGRNSASAAGQRRESAPGVYRMPLLISAFALARDFFVGSATFNLVPAQDLKRIEASDTHWEVTGNDPQIRLERKLGFPLRPGRYLLLTIGAMDLATLSGPAMYIDTGRGFNESEKLPMKFQVASRGEALAILTFTRPVLALRFDPTENGKHRFSLKALALRRLGNAPGTRASGARRADLSSRRKGPGNGYAGGVPAGAAGQRHKSAPGARGIPLFLSVFALARDLFVGTSTFKLVPVHDLNRIDTPDTIWEASGNDPQIRLESKLGFPLRAGRYLLLAKGAIEMEALSSPSIYVDTGLGFNESEKLQVKFHADSSGEALAILIFPLPVYALRFDPAENGKHRFSLNGLALRRFGNP